MHSKNFRNLVLIFFLAVTLVVLGFTGLLNISAFSKNITDSLISSYNVSGRECVRKVEYALRYGKTLPSFYGIEELLHRVKEDFPEIDDVQIVSTDGEILFNIYGLVRHKYIAPQLQEMYLHAGDLSRESSPYTLYKEQYHLFIPIRDRDNNLEGNLYISFPQEIISSRTVFYSRQLATYLGLLALLGIVALFVLSRFIAFTTSAGEINKKTFLVITLLLLGLIQVCFGWLNFNMFRSGYMEIARENSALLSNIIQKDIESVVSKGVPYHKLYNLEDYLERITATVPEIETIQLSVGDGGLLYSTADPESPVLNAEIKDPSMIYSMALAVDQTAEGANLQLLLSQGFFAAKERDILMDSITMLALSLILMVEIVIFMIILLRYQYEKGIRVDGQPARASFDVTIVRPLTLILAVSVFLSCSFIPLRMKELIEPLWGLSESIILGLPLSVEMLFAGLAAVLAGSLMDRKGWTTAFILGTVLFAVGLFLSYQAGNALTFIMARGFAGAGYGFTLMALRGFVNNRPSEKEKTEGFSAYISGVYAGFIIGVAAGAMLADRIGFARVFLVSLFVCLLAGFLVIYYLRMREIASSRTRTPYHLGVLFSTLFIQHEVAAAKAFDQKDEAIQEPREKQKGLLLFLRNLPVLSFFLFALLPLTVCGMFLDYYFPVFAASQAISTSDVGRAFMLNGIAVVYLGPVLTAYTRKHLSMARSILVSGLVIVAAFLLFYFFGSVAAAFVAVILLGVSESFGLVAQNNYFVNLKAVGYVGKGMALGYFDNIRSMGKMIGPMLFGGLMALENTGIGIVGIITLGALILFLISSKVEGAKN